MAADYDSEEIPNAPDDRPSERPANRNRVWLSIAAVLAIAILVFILVRQCAPEVAQDTAKKPVAAKTAPDTSDDEYDYSGTSGTDGSNSVPTVDGSSDSDSDAVVNPYTRAYPNASTYSADGDIYVRLTPGGATRRVTSGSPWDTDPQIAPNGTYLVFLRASSSGSKPSQVGIVDFETMGPSMLDIPISTLTPSTGIWYEAPVFAPEKGSTSPQSEWIVVPQMLGRDSLGGRLMVCNVWIESSWASWNLGIRGMSAITLSTSSRDSCVRVRSTPISEEYDAYDADFDCYSGWYTVR